MNEFGDMGVLRARGLSKEHGEALGLMGGGMIRLPRSPLIHGRTVPVGPIPESERPPPEACSCRASYGAAAAAVVSATSSSPRPGPRLSPGLLLCRWLARLARTLVRMSDDLRAELHRLVDEIAPEKLPAALARLADEHERPVVAADEALAALAALPGGLPPRDVAAAAAALSGEHRRAS
jgi:hypothetical protein